MARLRQGKLQCMAPTSVGRAQLLKRDSVLRACVLHAVATAKLAPARHVYLLLPCQRVGFAAVGRSITALK